MSKVYLCALVHCGFKPFSGEPSGVRSLVAAFVTLKQFVFVLCPARSISLYVIVVKKVVKPYVLKSCDRAWRNLAAIPTTAGRLSRSWGTLPAAACDA